MGIIEGKDDRKGRMDNGESRRETKTATKKSVEKGREGKSLEDA